MVFRNSACRILGSLALGACLAASSRAALWTVDDNAQDFPGADFSEIQTAIDAAASGDEIAVYPGVYVEAIVLKGKNLHLHSIAPADATIVATTVINAGQAGPVLLLDSTVTSATLIEGFTMTGGASFNGGGIRGDGTTATIRFNSLRGNAADNEGGALYRCDGLVQSNDVERNSASMGGGIAQCAGAIDSNLIANNRSFSGGGLYFCTGATSKNTISDNNAASQGGGLYRCFGVIENNQILRNFAVAEGGGLSACGGRVAGNRIAENAAALGGGASGGLARFDGNAIEKNQATASGGGLYQCGGPLLNNSILGNIAGADGGAMADCEQTSAVQNQFEQNVAAGSGGAVARGSGLLRNNLFSGNSAAKGGAVGDFQGRIDGNRLRENIAQRGGALSNCDGLMQNNEISANRASRGAGIDSCQGTIQNNTFAWNAGRDNGAGGIFPVSGEAIYFAGAGVALNDNIFSGYDGPAIVAESFDRGASRIFIERNMFSDSSAPVAALLDQTASYATVAELESGIATASGNSQADPRFVDPAGPDGDPLTAGDDDLRLQPDSPAIDAAGEGVMARLPVWDAGGLSRFVHLRADLGCYEFGADVDSDGDGLGDELEKSKGLDPAMIDSDGDGAADSMELLRLTDPLTPDAPAGLSVVPASGAIQSAIMRAFDGEAIAIQPGIYHEALAVEGKSVRLVGGQPALASSVPTTAAATVIDAAGRAPVVVWKGSATGGPTGGLTGGAIEGLTLTHGRTLGGGGALQANQATIALVGDILTSNTAIGDGGAIADLGGNIDGCIFSLNVAQNGGALTQSSATLTENLFQGNRALGSGGALFDCSGETTGNTFDGNSATDAGGAAAKLNGKLSGNTFRRNSTIGHGGAVSQSVKLISGNVFEENSAVYGGAIADSFAAATDNTMTSNTAYYGGAIAGNSGIVQRNEIIGNVALFGGGGLIDCSGAILDNLIQGNQGQSGGGIVQCSGKILRNTIINNIAPASGGGIASCQREIAWNLILGNSATDGGGLFDCDGWIHDNRIANNAASAEDMILGGSGGGLAKCDGRIELNHIENNSAIRGGGLYNARGPIVDNWIQGNIASFSGGGLMTVYGDVFGNLIVANRAIYGGAMQTGPAAIRNNTIAGNDVLPGGSGGGLHNMTGAIENNIFWQNGHYAIFITEQKYRPVSVRANDFWQNWDGQYVNLLWTVYGHVSQLDEALPEADGNFELDPLFVFPYGPDSNVAAFDDDDFRLRPDSPLIDLGRPVPGALPSQTDLAGEARIVPGFGDNGPIIDLGAYETYGVQLPAPDHPIAVSEGGSFVTQWRINPLLAGPGLRFELWQGGARFATLGFDFSHATDGSTALDMPFDAAPGLPYTIRGYSLADDSIWGAAFGTVTLLRPDERNAAENWRGYR